MFCDPHVLREASQGVESCSGAHCGGTTPPVSWSPKELATAQHVGWGPGRLQRRGSAFGLHITQLVVGNGWQATGPIMDNLSYLGTFQVE